MGGIFYLTVGIFLVSYGLIISEKIHQTVTAMAGACLLILLGILNQEEAIRGIDFNTIGLLIGMMTIVAITKHSGIFQYIAIWTAKAGKGHPLRIFILLGLITAAFSALLDNVTTVLLIVPVTFVIANNLKMKAKPFLLSAILLSNIGGMATLIGDPPNILIGSAAGISFNEFLVHLFPIALIVGIFTTAILVYIYRKSFVSSQKIRDTIMAFNPRDAISNPSLLRKAIFVLALVLVGFLTHEVTHLEGATVALSGAALLLILTLNEPEEHLREVEWTTIFFFIGLFILVTGLEQVGAIRLLAEGLIQLTHGNPTSTTLAILWGSGIFSTVVNNTPFVATMIPLIKDIGALTGTPTGPLWWALAIGADLGGNATIVGASANLIVAGMAEKRGDKIGFFEYLKLAAPLTFVGMIIATIYVYVRYLM